MNSAERKAEMLPRLFGQDVFEAIHEWFGNRPQIQPPHIRDLLSPSDSNYRHPQQQRHEENKVDSEPETDNPIETPPTDPVESTENSSPQRSPPRSMSTPTRPTVHRESTPSPGGRPSAGMLSKFYKSVSEIKSRTSRI